MDSPSFMKTIFLMHSCFVCLCSALGTFAYSHERIAQKWAAPASLPIAWRSSVELEERMRRSTQTGRAFCCTSFGSSFLYDLSCRRKSLAMLRSVSRFGSLCPFSLKIAATCRGSRPRSPANFFFRKFWRDSYLAVLGKSGW